MNKTLQRHLPLTNPVLAVALTIAPALALSTPQEGAESSEPVQRKVAILVYPGVELLDFAGPGEVFAAVRQTDVYTVAENKEPLTSMGFLTVTPEYTIADCPPPDIVVVPGGNVPSGSRVLQEWLKRCSSSSELIVSVCNGAALLANAGLLEGLEVTTHHSALEQVALIEPSAKVYTNRRFVDNGKIITTAGISAGIDGSLYVVERLYGKEVALRTARYMEYDWRPEEIAKEHAAPGVLVEFGIAARILRELEGGAAEGIDIEGVHERHAKALAEASAEELQQTQRRLNSRAYSLLGGEETKAALAVFRFQVAAFPGSANPLDSLSEAYETLGDKENALRLARQTLALIPKDKGGDKAQLERVANAAESRIARLTGKAAEAAWSCPPCGQACDEKQYVAAGECPGCRMTLEKSTP